MKYIFVLLLLMISTSSCRKSESMPDAGVVKEYVGKWNWYYSVGGFSAEISKPGKDTAISLWLGQDSTYTTYLNGVKVSGGHFNTELIPYWDSALLVHYDHYLNVGNLRVGENEGVELFSKDTLRLYDAFISDGFAHIFVRGK